MMLDVLEEHLSEAAFFWSQWEHALVAPDYTLEETAELEERLLAHLDGLVAAGAVAIEVLAPVVHESEDPGEVFAAAWSLLALAPSLMLDAVKARATDGPSPVQASMRRALELGENGVVETALVPWLTAVEPMAVSVLGFRGHLPDDRAEELLSHPDALVVAAALRAFNPSSKSHAPRLLGVLLGDSRPEVRWAAIETGLVFGVRDAWTVCEGESTDAGSALRRRSWVLLAAAGDARFLERLISFSEETATREDALWALGFSGRVSAAEACLRWMCAEPRVARLAGEAFSAITGLRMAGAHVLPEPAPEDALPPLEDEDLDADLVLRPEDALPLPAQEEVARWWDGARDGFSPANRYLGGKLFAGTSLLDALAQGPMRRRHPYALELMVRTRGTHAVQVRAFTSRQREQLALASAVRERMSSWGFRS
ncbi:TIGR02270 family protein [Myxococcus sp. SDU36]|uniref:TIGR02270 family protein n=1 Tax=Myxococcus sp. SDU36 TaxID=2831967 RepID=UPI002543C107|nr:TIGR02270 family protein [Myxococcus sp. SDU36]WIG95908.1 TIGR02270 family protein [Myxococcus sp. SDU36]